MLKKALWVAVALRGAGAFGTIALARGEPLNAVWLVTAVACLKPAVACLLFMGCRA